MNKENYCVQVTQENRQQLRQALGSNGFCWSVGAYYGRSGGEVYGNKKAWTTVYTFEQFKANILNTTSSYEIY